MIITMIKWIRTSRLSIKNSLSQASSSHCRANMAHKRQPMPDYGLGFQVKGLEPFQVVLSLLGSGLHLNHSQGWNNYFTQMCSGSEAGSYLRLLDFVCH